MTWRRVLLLALFASFLLPRWAQAADTATAWVKDITTQMEFLFEQASKGEKPEKNLKKASKLVERLLRQMGPSSGTCPFFARALLLRSVFAAQLGKWEEAIWDFQIALSLEPALTEFNMAGFGVDWTVFEKAKKDWKKAAQSWNQKKKTIGKEALGFFAYDESRDCPILCEPPRKRNEVNPEYPEGCRFFREQSAVVIQVVIRKDGSVGDPYFPEMCERAPFLVAAAEAIRHWRYDPPTCDGKNTEMMGTITVNFVLRK